MTFDELIVTMQARLGHPVKYSLAKDGRIEQSSQAVLTTYNGGTTDPVAPDELGRVAFGCPYPGLGFVLDPSVVTGWQESSDGRLLRVDMYGGAAFLIETVESAERPSAPGALA